MTDRPLIDVRFVGKPRYGNWVAFVTDPAHRNGVVRVRFRRGEYPAFQWRCDACGPLQFATCRHARAAAIRRQVQRDQEEKDR